MIRKISRFFFFFAMGAFLILMPLAAVAVDEAGDTEGGESEGLLQKYPGALLQSGTIDQIGAGDIVIDDRGFLLTPATDYYTSSMGKAPKGLFQEGLSVEFIVENEIEIKAIRLVP